MSLSCDLGRARQDSGAATGRPEQPFLSGFSSVSSDGLCLQEGTRCSYAFYLLVIRDGADYWSFFLVWPS